jgi:hypothetical protein
MKSEKFLMTMFLMTLTIFLCTNNVHAKDDKKKKKGPKLAPKQIPCEMVLLTSYLLHGRHKSKPDPMYLCPTIKNNCCTKMDQQRIYHIAKEFLPQRLLEYQSKIRMALAKLRDLHIKIHKAKPVFSGKPARRLFCNAQAQKLFNLPFFKMYNEMLEFLDIVRDELEDYYNTFFCQICDADNHKFFNMKTKQLQMDAEFCKDMIENHQDAIKVFNVQLIEYLKTLQNVVDCTHYVRSFNLDFFDRSKQKLSKGIPKCLTSLGSKDFQKNCKKMCESMKISKVIETIEGDFEFVIDAVNLFEKFFEFKESGSFISMKLRAFFKRFVVPRAKSRKNVYRFLHDVERGIDTKNKTTPNNQLELDDQASTAVEQRKLLQTGTEEERQLLQTGAGQERQLLQTNTQEEKQLQPSDNSTPRPGDGLRNMIPKLPDLNSAPTDMNNTKIAIDPVDALSDHLDAINSSSQEINQRLLSEGAAKPEQSGEKKDDKKTGKPPKKKFAKLVYNKELFNFYNELHIKKPAPEERLVFSLRHMPVDLDELKKIFATNTGLDPRKYMGTTKFDMDQPTLYRLLFNHVDNDKPDVEIMMFLNDFTEKYKTEIYHDIDTPFKIKVKAKKQKKVRVLEKKENLA